MTRTDALILEALAQRLERKLRKWERDGYRTSADKVARARGEAAAIRRVLSSACAGCGSPMRVESSDLCARCLPDRAGG